MPASSLDPRTALVLIDLQNGILAMPTLTPAAEILKQGTRLTRAFRARELPVVFVRVGWSADGGDLPAGRSDAGRLESAPPAAFSEFPSELGVQDGDIVITKRHWGAFTGTELDLQLRRRGVTQIVLAGIATSIGVESTARSAYELGYHLTIVEDATTDTNAEAHANSFKSIFPRLCEVDTTDRVIELLAG
ncbi:hydrolase [Streptomyces sp. AP-93]|uniref:hydrolase n=1 Tax=Streptomyces sp. AP-93 TaxID=2929048 RepID=UPI001FAEE873|nr:hydrolase [Streptomyces sp. AP-93]MCJ0872553.1 hydrolase [Streptomyces sp. AP-93]